MSEETRVLIAYQSQTGNTKKVAEAIYRVIPEPKEIKPLKKVKSLDDYDLVFLGFPIHGSGPNMKAKEFLENITRGKKMALFITHAAPEEAPEIPESLQKFKDAAAGAEIMDVFHCQGQLSGFVKTIMRIVPDPKLRMWAKMDSSKGQPDKSRLEKAGVFASKVMEKHSTAATHLYKITSSDNIDSISNMQWKCSQRY